MKRAIASLIGALSVLVWTLIALGQQAPRVPAIGWLAMSAGPNDPAVQAFRSGMSDIGYVEGRDYRLEHRRADNHLERLAPLAEELVRLDVAVILTATPHATRAAMQATRTIPIVTVAHDHDPVASGLIQSFSHPGGNVTGLTIRNTQLAGKRLELLKEAIPSLTRVAAFRDSFGSAELDALNLAAASLGIQVQPIDLSPAYDLRRAFKAAKDQRAEAIVVLGSAALYVRSRPIGAMALSNKVPTIGAYRDLVEAGGFMSYSTDIKDGFYRTAYFVDRLLKGAKASDLPFEQTADVKLLINAKAAQAIGITVPQSILLRADEVVR